jgi:hypothetical protein
MSLYLFKYPKFYLGFFKLQILLKELQGSKVQNIIQIYQCPELFFLIYFEEVLDHLNLEQELTLFFLNKISHPQL